jgi:hypothetical protein
VTDVVASPTSGDEFVIGDAGAANHPFHDLLPADTP